ETDSLADINEVSDDSNINEVNQPDKPESQGDMNSATSGHDSGTSSEKSSQTVQSVNDVISVFLVVAKDRVIKGEHIYSACLGNNLQYGDMKIFHRLASDGEIMFSLSDMRKPGWFDIDQINSHITRGVSLFTQLSMVSDPVKTVDDMLLCAHKMAGLLGAQLCGQDRMLLNESSVKLMREKAKGFADGRLSANI
ncbi:MAG: cell division protein ZipA C-terminal FtsZ-binding domain-containing protein, partial [Gammaproteobacteria bacterium]|nr:cell division protein ZipA C-terminal FtsZ-binding domain-containing protein [Gammaproteobacteria bacterium]